MTSAIISTCDLDEPATGLCTTLAAICAIAAKPLEQARALPATAFTNQQYFDWESEHILKRQWLSIAHVSQLRNTGDYVNLELLGLWPGRETEGSTLHEGAPGNSR
jgi:hypothetical protein